MVQEAYHQQPISDLSVRSCSTPSRAAVLLARACKGTISFKDMHPGLWEASAVSQAHLMSEA